MLKKIQKISKKAGQELIELALTLFYCVIDTDTPLPIKSLILGDLAYLVCPFDLIPDLTPGIGFSDDLTVLLGTLALIPRAIKDEHKRKAAYTAGKWFSSVPNKNTPCKLEVTQ